ncbi:MAG TPA: hypothetical protein VKU02_13400, partial [Gemmataceae bacterium]|nr:hypothetical protein [Gemmataceae bacterium]
ENFKQKFGIYPPSRILLAERFTDYFRNGDPTKPFSQFHADSYSFLTQIFPRLDMVNSVNKPSLNHSTWWAGIDWDGNKVPSPPVILEGDQCLVFFLGGIPQIDANSNKPFCSGFSTNASNPAAHILGGGDVFPPLFEFSSDRLVFVPQGARASGFIDVLTKQPLPAISTVHLSYKDTYGNVPYAYFSSYKARNGYNRYLNSILLGSKPSSDCTSLGVWPYAEGLTPSVRYLNANTFQIISAGANGLVAGVSNMNFGRGTEPNNPKAIWTPSAAGGSEANRSYFEPPPPQPPQAGIDDQSNFYDSTLGSSS